MTRKRGVYFFRRRLPRPFLGEFAMSLGTRHFRIAQYLAESLTAAFEELVAQSMTSPNLQIILSEYLREHLASARKALIKAPHGESPFGKWVDYSEFPEAPGVAGARHWIAQFKEDLRAPARGGACR